MAATARMLLEAEPNLTPASRRYLVAAGMLGAIAHGDPVAAHEIWTSFGGTLPDDLLIRMLVMRSGE